MFYCYFVFVLRNCVNPACIAVIPNRRFDLIWFEIDESFIIVRLVASVAGTAERCRTNSTTRCILVASLTLGSPSFPAATAENIDGISERLTGHVVGVSAGIMERPVETGSTAAIIAGWATQPRLLEWPGGNRDDDRWSGSDYSLPSSPSIHLPANLLPQPRRHRRRTTTKLLKHCCGDAARNL